MAITFEQQIEQQLNPLVARLTGGAASVVAGSVARLTGGYDTEVFAFDVTGGGNLPPQLVLRLFRHVSESPRPVLEAVTQNWAADNGLPAPRVFAGFSGERIAERPFILMSRVAGRLLIDAFLESSQPLNAPALLASFQARLHGVDATALSAGMTRAGLDPHHMTAPYLLESIAEIVADAGIAAIQPVIDWLGAHMPAAPATPVACHCDLHPANFLVADGKLAGVIDWGNIQLGRPEFDVAITRLILTCGPLLDPRLGPAAREMAAQVVAAYIAEYKRLAPLDDMLLDYFETLRAMHAVARVMARQVRPGVPDTAPEDYPWGRPAVFAVLADIVQRHTGIAIT